MVNISVGYNAQIGWGAEAAFAEGADTTLAAAVNGMGIITDCTINTSVERTHVYGIGNQTRVNDPILSESYEWSVSILWQNAATDTAYEFIKDIIDNYGASRKSYCIRIDTIPDGSTTEILYLEGATINNISIDANVGDVVKTEISGIAKEVFGDDWTSTKYPNATDVTVDTTDPEQYHGSAIGGFSNIVDVSSQLTKFHVEINYNNNRIDTFSGANMVLASQGAIEVSFSGTVYGDGTSMGVGDMLSDMIGDQSDNLTFGIDGTKTLTLTGASLDSVNYPIKEKESIMIDFEGRANSPSIN